MKPKLKHALESAMAWLESVSDEEFLTQFDALGQEEGVSVDEFTRQLKQSQRKLTCTKCGCTQAIGQLNKIAKLSHLGVRQEHCITKQCNFCNSRLFYSYS